MNKNCGNCGWSTPIPAKTEHDVNHHIRARVNCNWELHNRIPKSIRHFGSFMYADDTMSCPCWKDKE